MELGKWISKNDTLIMLEITNASLFCKTEGHYRKLIEEFNRLLSFDCFISGLADTRHISYGRMMSASINIGYPPGYFETYLNHNYHLIDPLIQLFYKTLEVQNSKELKDLYKLVPDHPVLRLREDFVINNIFFYGICDSELNSFTIFSIVGQPIKNDQRTRAIIKYLAPYLSIAIKHLIPFTKKADVVVPTHSELEVLKWLKEGKSSWEISMILNRSERVINFHINNILKKLNAMNRTHAVAIAMENNLFIL